MEPSPYAGVGGKIRRRPPPRAVATPYDRPPAAAAAHRLAAAAAAAYPRQGGEGGGWVARLVDPASRLIAGGAARLFSTVFRKRLAPAPVPVPAPSPPLSTPPGKPMPPGSIPIMEKGKMPAGTSDEKALVEFDRLTDVLRARTVESDLPAPVDYREDKNEARIRIDGTGGSTSRGIAANRSLAADDPVSGASLPAELAKQYMNSRYSREPQKNSLRSRVLIKNKADASNITYDTNRSGGPLVQEPNQFGNENSELTLNGHVTPGLRGRSAIYRMSRSPFFKGPSSSNDVNMSPFSQSQARAHSLVSGGRQVLKRRGTDLDDELASIGPIRRIRQKSIMVSTFRDSRVSPQGNFLPNRTIGSDLTDGSSPIQCPSSKRPLLGTGQSVQPAEEDRNVEDGKSAKSSSDNVLAVSPQSNKMADKIFEQLNIIVPSPKKQSCAQSVNGNVSCSTLKQPVWQDNEPNSASDPTSSQKFQYMDRVNHSLDPELNGSPFSNAKLRKDGSSKLSGSFQDFGNKDIKSDNVAMSNKPAILENSVSATISGKPGFKMAVFEDLSEFDDDQEPPVQSKYSAGKTGVKRTDNKFDLKIKEQKVESNLVEKVVSAPVSEKPIASPPKDVLCLGLFSPNDAEKRANPDVPSYNNIGLRFPHIPHDTHPKSAEPEVSLASNKDNKLTSASAFTFGLKQSSASGSEPSNTAGVKTETGLGER
ncbi:hypothetical protein GUJ93_ZPchr0013g36016 [Zizania palustris]|uniref:Uncharacterized protein n=1 Tax=Zizania palustris TaxID=103762 RepID=A0A8J5WYX6_ZIZPA|nr:hypothetical protein GUJ93_ZPchr0013g36016 [Zizania palustris]